MASHSFHARLDALQQNRERQGSERTFKTQISGICFSDNDYLGLSCHEQVIASAQQALRDYGTGARAARLLAGPCPEHRLLEENLAQWKGTERALLFSSGYLTPLGVVPTLVSPGDTVLMERQAHACLFDGARLSGARIRLFDRKNMPELKKNLVSTRKLAPESRILIIAESLHSMDGDFAPLREIIDLKNESGAWLLLDEAHAGGICGPSGAGLAAELDLIQQVEIQMGTMGKALGSSGGFVAATEKIIHLLMNEARTFLFGTALAPASVLAAQTSLTILRSPEGDLLRKKLTENITNFRSAFFPSVSGPIQPVFLGSNQLATKASDQLHSLGLDVPAIRTPTIPKGTARLRISLSARHSDKEIQQLGQALMALPKE
jgi:8-amino-7-oxononanoate synthase